MTGKLFDRNVPRTTEIFQKSVVGIAGCGGLGSNAAMALARAGIGTLILADFDVVEESNLNRQHYFRADIGKPKVRALASHLRAVNPDIKLILHDERLTAETVPQVFAQATILIEAFDRAESKHWLIESWCRHFPERHIVCASGVSGIGNTDSLRVITTGKIHLCGDGESDMSEGLCSARVAIAANMEANVTLELLLSGG
jgi:sulfur carrier protein ThiS adenylyltransferase